jgi:4-amino-4-deoxy-L-arabinose transferase-like glycosyltransferase
MTLVLIAAVAVYWLVYHNLLLTRGPFHWDEALHALKGVQIAGSLQQGDWLGFLLDSYRQVLYPPVHSWLAAIAYLVAGPSVVSIGVISLICFVATAPVLYLAGRALHDDQGTIAGIVAATLFLTSPPLISYATQAMLEIPGMLPLCLTFLIYFRLARDDTPPRSYMLLGFAIVLTYFVRMPYGVFLCLIVMAALLVEAQFHPLRFLDRKLLYTLLPMVVLFGLWFAYPPKIAATLRWLINEPNVPEPYAVAGWLFYPLATVWLSGSIWLFGLALVAVIVAAVAFRHDRRIRFLLVLVVIQMALAEFHPNKQQRYLFPLLPALFLLSGFVVAEWWSRARSTRQPLLQWLPALLTAGLIVHAGFVLRDTLQGEPVEANHTDEPAAAIAQIVSAGGPALVIGSMELSNPSPPLLDWYLITQARLLDVSLAGSLAQIEEERQLLSQVRTLPMPSWLMGQFEQGLTRSDRPNQTRSLYIGLPDRATYSQSREALYAFLNDLFAATDFDSVIVMTITRPNARYPLDYIAPGLEQAGLRHTERHAFEDARLQIDVYQ